MAEGPTDQFDDTQLGLYMTGAGTEGRDEKRIEKMIPTVLSLAIALFFGSFLFMAVGYNPVSVYSEIIYGAVGTHGAVLNSLVQATPLCLQDWHL